MSATRQRKMDVEKLIEKNEKVNGDQVREAQDLLRELRRDGVGGPSYDIVSPYERRSFVS